MANNNRITSFRQKTGLDDNEKVLLFEVLSILLRNQDVIMKELRVNVNDVGDDDNFYSPLNDMGFQLCMEMAERLASKMEGDFEEEE